MPLVKLSIKDRFDASVLDKTYTCPDISIALDKFRTKYPECWVSLVEVEDNELHNALYGGDFAFCAPLNMTKDELLVMNDEIDIKEFQLKWYPKSTVVALNQEDLCELEVEDTEDFIYDLPDPDCN